MARPKRKHPVSDYLHAGALGALGHGRRKIASDTGIADRDAGTIARLTGMSVEEFREAAVEEAREIRLALADQIRKRMDDIPPSFLVTGWGIAGTKERELTGGTAGHVGTQINIQVNGVSSREGLLESVLHRDPREAKPARAPAAAPVVDVETADSD